jgi:two-component system sensor histidine kinase PilS (NtrC family)
MFEKRQTELVGTVVRLLFIRFLLTFLSIGVIIAYANRFPVPPPFSHAYHLLICVLLLNIAYLAIARFVRRLRLFIAFQIAIDGVAETALIYLTGGPRSPLSFLYYASILSASMLISKRGGLLFASAATVFLCAVTISYFLAAKLFFALPLVPYEWVQAAIVNLNTLSGYLVAQAIALHLVAFLSGQLAEKALNMRFLYGSVIENMAEGLLVTDRSLRIIFANREAKRLFGPDNPIDITGKRVQDVLPGLRERKVMEVLESDSTAMIGLQMPTSRDNSELELEAKISSFRNKRGRTVGKIIILTDVTIRRQLEETQKRTRHLAEIEEMSVGLAHEIRNPLASIRGCTQELGRADFSDTDTRRLADIVCRESDRLDKIVSDFLGFARMQPPMFARCELARLVDEIVTLLRSRTSAQGVEIFTEVPEKLILFCDGGQIKQILLNLGINSLDALDGVGYIRISAKRKTLSELSDTHERPADMISAEGILVEFEDSGKGIPQEHLKKIFTPFFTTKPNGAGVGLAIVNKIVANHGGLITVKSAPPKGTLFGIWLPLYPRGARKKTEALW